MKRILIIEDDQGIAELERDYLEANGFSTDIAADGKTGEEKALGEAYDLILLDIMLPGRDGFQICRAIRATKDIPILIVSARQEDIDKIRGLGLGADDYIVKPFSPNELVARVKGHLARYEQLTSRETHRDVLRYGDLEIDESGHRVPEKLVLPIWQRLWQKIMASPAVILLVLAAVLCLAANHLLVVTDPVESNYVLTAREMLASGDYVSPRIFGNYWYDKPVFFYWELIAAFKLFGVSDFAARFFPALFGIVGIFLAYGFTARLYDKKTAFLTGLILLTTVEYFYLSKAIITDMTLFVFYSACLMAFYIAYSEGKPRWYYLAYFFAGLAVLTKGPIGLFQPGLIILLFLLWRRDFKALLHIKLVSGLTLFLATTLVWYGPMYALHGSDFISQFIGVHNILRATVSEHPQYNVWYYYSAVFLAGFVPWVFTLPLAWRDYGLTRKIAAAWREKRLPLPAFSMKTQFLIVWAAVIFVTYQLMATKYMTYTFPYMIPLAIGFASYLKKYDRLVLNLAGIVIAIYVAVTFTVIVPQCRQASAYGAAQVVSSLADDETTVVTYGGRYPVSLTYYSGHTAYRLAERDNIARMLPGGISWNAKNVMPFMAIEDLPDQGKVLAVVRDRDEARFLQDVSGTWQWRAQKGVWVIYQKVSDL